MICKRSAQDLIFLIVVTIALAYVAVSNQSYWIDEMTCKKIAASDSWSEFTMSMNSESGSDAQMPLFQGGMFIWDKICDGSERGFRLINVWFWLIGVIALTRFFKTRGEPVWGVIAASGTSAFLWFYVDEARPYAMQFAGASCLLAGYWMKIVKAKEEVSDYLPWGMLLVGTLLCAGSSLLGAPFAGLIFLCVLIDVLRERKQLQLSETILFGIWCLILIALTSYYLWTLAGGKGASGINKTSYMSLGFSVFEQLGFMPFGPGRFALREEGLSSLGSWTVGLIGWLIAVIFILFEGGRRLLESQIFGSYLYKCMFPVVCMIVILVAGGYAGGFRILGRHFMPVFPLFLIVLALAYVKLWKGGNHQKIVCVLILLFSLFGCLIQRYTIRHQKDDYRGAAAYVNYISEGGGTIWWAAAVPIYDFKVPANVIQTRNFNEAKFEEFSKPNLVVLSKTDLYDSEGHLRKWLQRNNYVISKELPAFKFYKHYSKENNFHE